MIDFIRDGFLFMKGGYIKVLNFLAMLGFFLIATGFLIIFYDSDFAPSLPILIGFLVFQIILGFVIQLLAIRKTKSIYHIFSGALFFICGLISLLLLIFDDIKFSQVWPLYGFFCGLILLECSWFRHRKVRAEYGIPAFVVIVMSIYYSLFSLKIIKVSLSFISFFVAPVLIVGLTLLLVVFYFLQKKHKELVLDDENSDEFSYEEYLEDD